MSAAAPVAPVDPRTIAPAERMMITFAVMSSTLMQVLDTTIVNVALPHMSGELGTTSDQISWVLTSYLVSSAICMPLTGYMADALGRKRFLLICISGFVISSALCGLSRSLTQIVLFRMLQGVFGAALVPLSQAIMADAYPPEDRGKAMAIWGLGVMVGPVAGPTLGGWLTDVASWRWTFYINVPVGALSLFLAMSFVPDTVRRLRQFDWTGFALMALGIASLQYLLDRGNHQDWFEANDIRITAVLTVLGLAAFVAYSLRYGERAIFNVRLFNDRNFGVSCLIMHRNHVNPTLHRVQDAIIKNPAAQWSASQLASVACMSSRNLARLFAEHAGCSPLDYVQRLRVALARELVSNSEMGMERVAEKTGFSSAHQLRRVWRRWEEAPPTTHRARVSG